MFQRKKETTLPRQDVPVLETDPNVGLTTQQAEERTQKGWANGLTISASRSEREIILANLLTFFNFVFVALAAVLAIAGAPIKNMTFLIIVFCNIAIGCFQEIRAKRAVDKLTLVAAQQLKTVRDGQIMQIRSDLLVRDDVVEFTAGDQICADAVLLTGELRANEALVTGEEDAIIKMPGAELKSGSFVVAGSGRARLTEVGGDSFAAKLAAEAKADPRAAKSEMMNALDKLIRVVGFALIPVGLLLFYQEFKVLELPFMESVTGTVAALVGMIPEGLYLLTSIAMAASALVLARRKVLVQDMNCIETLARVDVLCVDKTGTITESIMEVENVIPLTQEPPERLENVLSAIYSGVEPENDTARAMAEMFAAGTDWSCTQRIPFTSETKWSAAEFRGHGTFVVGAPEFTMGSRYEELRQQVEEYSAQGYRVLLVAQYAGQLENCLEPGKLRPLALVLLTNRVRPEAPETFRYFAAQGVAVKVISGDNPVTVAEVARRAGIPYADRFVDAGELETEEDFLQAVKKYAVFGRVTPDKKKALIRAFRKRGHTVAMTGDGVNDVLAMKESDCSVAMASGAQAASQVAKLVLLKSDFSAMPGIVAEGRRVINNIQRAATLFLVKNIFSMGLALLSLATGFAYPLLPIHLTLISTLTIGIPSFFLAMEPNYERVKGKFLPTVLRRALPGGVTNILVILLAQAFRAGFSLPSADISTICTAVLATVGLLVLFETCKPFDTFRKIIWAAMAVGLLCGFLLLPGLFELKMTDWGSGLLLLTLLITTPTVFFAMQKFFDLTDRVMRRGKTYLSKRKK